MAIGQLQSALTTHLDTTNRDLACRDLPGLLAKNWDILRQVFDRTLMFVVGTVDGIGPPAMRPQRANGDQVVFRQFGSVGRIVLERDAVVTVQKQDNARRRCGSRRYEDVRWLTANLHHRPTHKSFPPSCDNPRQHRQSPIGKINEFKRLLK